jgi:hypothetical protein
MQMRPWREWPVYGLLTGPGALDRGAAVTSPVAGALLRPQAVSADWVVDSVCPWCAGGCRRQVNAHVTCAQEPCDVVTPPRRGRPDLAAPDHGDRR